MKSPLCHIELDERRKELASAGNATYPISAFYNDLNQMPYHEIPWHWHEYIEVLYVFCGSIEVCVGHTKFCVHEKEGMFLNTSVLHSIKKHSDACIFYSFVFSPSFISGNSNNRIHQTFIIPILNNTALPYLVFHQHIKWQQEATSCILRAFEEYEKGSFGYEILVREKLSMMWYFLCTHDVKESLSIQTERLEVTRIKQMLAYIHSFYQTNITIYQIAKHTNISEREVLRCFQKVLHDSPISYLSQYRITQATALLQEPDKTITQISTLCGFDTPSYFTKVFKKQMGVTPSAYRKNKELHF